MVQSKMTMLSDVSNKPKLLPGNNVELNIWDFAGQAVYYTTHQVVFNINLIPFFEWNPLNVICKTLKSSDRYLNNNI